MLPQIDVGNLPWAVMNASLDLYLTEVLPVIKHETAGRRTPEELVKDDA